MNYAEKQMKETLEMAGDIPKDTRDITIEYQKVQINKLKEQLCRYCRLLDRVHCARCEWR